MTWKNPNWCKLDPSTFRSLVGSLKDFYPLRGRPSQFHPVMTLFARNNFQGKRLNHKFELQEILEIVERFNTNVHTVRGKVRANCNSYKKSETTRTCLVKEIPLLSKGHLKIWDSVKNRPLRCQPDSYELYRTLFNIENPAMIEVLCTFLTSNLVENNLSPHFPLFYGTVNSQFKNFTYSERASKDLETSKSPLVPKRYRVVREGSRNRIQVNNCPVQLLFTEMIGEETLGDIVDREKFQGNRWRSYCFQVVAALSIIQSRYKMYHNDLHINNLMCQKTKLEYLYYRGSNGKHFKVPTYGKIVKIIDWGRATVKYKNNNLGNQCFDPDGDVFGQYHPPTSINHKRRLVYPNSSIDMVMFAYTMLESFYINSPDYKSVNLSSSHSSHSTGSNKKDMSNSVYNIDQGRRQRLELLPHSDVIDFLLDICAYHKGKNFYTHCQKLNFTFYCEAAKWSHNSVPRDLIQHNIFKKFEIHPSLHQGNKHPVYPLE